MMKQLYRERLPDAGWVALIQWPDGRIALRIRGQWVYEQPPKPRKIAKLSVVKNEGT